MKLLSLAEALQAWLRRTSLRRLLTRWVLALLIFTQLVVGGGVYLLASRFLWQFAAAQQRGVILVQWEHRPGHHGPRPPWREHPHHDHGPGGPRPGDHGPGGPPPGEHGPDDHGPEGPPPFHESHHHGPSAEEWLYFFAEIVSSANQGVRLWGTDGSLLHSYGNMDPVPAPAPELLKILFTPHPQELPPMFLDGSDENVYVLLVPLPDNGRTAAVMEVANNSASLNTQIRALAGYIAVCSGLALLLGTAAVFWLTRALTGPLEKLYRVTRRMGGGDLSARTGLEAGENEVYAVAAAFDHMADRLQEVFTSQRRFLADASHELKTPLTAISGMAEVLQTGEVTPEERRKAVSAIGREVSRMNALIADLLTLSRVEEEAPGPARIGLRDLFEELMESASMVFPENAVECDCPSDLQVFGDEGSTYRIFRNLLDNALQHTPSDRVVRLEGRQVGNMAEVRVIDRGAGIPAEDLPHVFERFYRADRSRARRTGGTGLGLAIVAAAVEALEGRISIESSLGQGTTVTVLLPCPQAGD